MSENLNLLVVEDDPFIVDQLYKPQLTNPRLHVDYASTEAEAKEQIRCKTYHVAYVDIMLRVDRYDRGGIEVIKFLHELKESTSIIVVSASDDIRVALSAYKAGICDFLPKDSIHSPGEILVPLEKILEGIEYQKTSPFGRFSNISAFLANPELTPYWEDEWVRRLGTSYKLFVTALNNSLEYRLPILRMKGKRSCLTVGEDVRTGYGYFWSKGIGQAIMMSLAFVDRTLPAPSKDVAGEVIYERTYRNLKVAIWAIKSGKSRSEFLDSVWDEPV